MQTAFSTTMSWKDSSEEIPFCRLKYVEVQGSSKRDASNLPLVENNTVKQIVNRKVASTIWFQPEKVLDEKPRANLALEAQSAVPFF